MQRFVGVWPEIFAGHLDLKDKKFTGPGLLLRVFDPRTYLISNVVYNIVFGLIFVTLFF